MTATDCLRSACLALAALLVAAGASAQGTARPTHGAIALSPGIGNHAWSTGWPTPMAAERDALTRCAGRNGPASGCQIVARLAGDCGALAVDDLSRSWGASTRLQMRDAIEAALAGCKKDGGQRCLVKTSYCSR